MNINTEPAIDGRPVPWALASLDALATRIETHGASGRVVWRAWGSGPALVLLHGGAGSWRHWLHNIALLALRYRVIVPDLPGMGCSDAPVEATPQAEARMLAEGLPEVLEGRADFDLVGFSFGGLISGHLAAAVMSQVRSYTIVGTGSWEGLPRHNIVLVPVRHLSIAEQWPAHHTNLSRMMIADVARIDDTALWIQAWNSQHARLDSRKFYRQGPLSSVIPNLSMPINAIWGSEDATTGKDIDAREKLLRSLCPGLQFCRIEGAGHWVAYERPEAFNAVLLELLAPTYPAV